VTTFAGISQELHGNFAGVSRKLLAHRVGASRPDPSPEERYVTLLIVMDLTTAVRSLIANFSLRFSTSRKSWRW
jgi:hypothetical protein